MGRTGLARKYMRYRGGLRPSGTAKREPPRLAVKPYWCYSNLRDALFGAICANPLLRALNSAVECHLHTVEVAGSNPAAPTIESTTCRHFSIGICGILWQILNRPFPLLPFGQ